MTVPSTELRSVTIHARTSINTGGPSLWVAEIGVGLLNRTAEQDAPVGPAQDTFRAAAVRVIAQDRRSGPITVSGNEVPGYHTPRLVQAAVRARADGHDSGQGPSTLIVNGGGDSPGTAGTAELDPRIAPIPLPYSDVLLGLNDGIKSKLDVEIELPELTLEGGAIATLLRLDAGNVARWLGITSGNPTKIFGTNSPLAIVTTKIGTRRYLPVWLVPEGIEFDTTFADPFSAGTTAPALTLRVLLTYDIQLSQFVLRPSAMGPVKADADRLRASFDALMGRFGGAGKPLIAEVAPHGLPFALSLGAGVPGSSLNAASPSSAIYIDRDAIRVRLNSDAPDGSAIPTVCQLKVRGAKIGTGNAANTLTISCDSRGDPPGPATATAASKLVNATFTWVVQADQEDHDVSLRVGDSAPQIIDTAEFERRLRKRYDAAGLNTDPKKPIYAFFPLERGMLQLPLPVPPSPSDRAPPSPPPVVDPSAFSGLVRSRMHVSDNRDDVAVEVTAAISAEITVTLASGKTTTKVKFTGARGTATGFVFAAAASPSPSSILPSLDHGPIACEPLNIVFGDPHVSSTLSVKWDIVPGPPSQLKMTIALAASAGPATAWRAHPRMALVSTMPMTRTRFDATRPMTTRDLVPFTIPSGQREFVLTTFLDKPQRSPFPDITFDTTGVKPTNDPAWPWPITDDNPDTGEANDAISNVSTSSLTLPGIEMSLVGARDWGTLGASLRYDLPILGELFASATLPKSSASSKSPQTGDTTEHAPTALEPEALTRHWQLTANRHALSRTVNDRVSKWTTPGATPSNMVLKNFVEPYSFASSFGVAVESAGLPLGTYTLFGKTVAGSTALAGWSGSLTSQENVTVNIVGFSARLSNGTAGTAAAQFDTRGIGQAMQPRVQTLLPQGQLELRDTALLDSVSGSIKPTNAVAVTAAHISFSLAGDEYGLRLRDLPMVADQHGNLSFDPTVSATASPRAVTGPEGYVGPDGSVFERKQLSNAVYEWSFYKTVAASAPPSFVFQLGALNLRPLRLVGASFAKEATGLRLSGFEMIANVEPSAAITGSGGPISDDAPYQAGNPVALTFTLGTGTSIRKASLAAIRPVSVKDRTILIGSANVATVSLPAIADLGYGAVDTKPADVSRSRAHGSLPIVLEMGLQATGTDTKITIISAKLNCVLFGAPVQIPFGNTPLSDALAFNYQPTGQPPAQFQVQRIGLTWSRGASPVLLLCARLRLPGAVVATPLPAGLTRDLVDWQVGSTLRWFGAKLSPKELTGDDQFSFDADHNKGTLNLAISIKHLPEQAEFIQGWSVAGAPFTLATAVAFALPKSPALFPDTPSAGFAEVTCGAPGGLFIRHRSRTPGRVETQTSRIVVSLPNLKLTSAIAWPLDGLTATFPDPFAPSSRAAADWRQDIKVEAANEHTHHVTLAVRDAELSAVNLFESGGAVTLGAPWTFPAIATHTLDGGRSLTWTSVDEIVVGHRSALEREAAGTLDTPPGELGFVARYRGSARPNLQPFTVSAGVFSKAMARAGVPTLELLISLRLAQKANAASGSSSAAAASDLFISGAAIVEIGAEEDSTRGHRVVTPWISPLFDAKALGVLGSIPQAPWSGRVSPYDLAPHAANRLSLGTPIPCGTNNASIAWIKRFRERIAGSMPQQQISSFEPVSQSVIEDTDLPADGADPAHWLSRPIWLRTLAAWKGVLATTRKKPVADRAVTVTPIVVGDPGGSLRTTAVRLALRRSVNDEQVASVAATDTTWQPGSSYEVIVLTRNSVAVVAVANDEAKTLHESQQPMAGDERNRLAQLALSVPDEPLAAALGELTDVSADLLPDNQQSLRTHRVGGFLELPGYLDAVQQPHRLRDRTRMVFASAALAWPRASVRAGWNGAVQTAALELGDQRPLQDAQYSWAGDVRSFSVTGAAPAPGANGAFRNASVLTTGQRALFRRPTDEDLTAPPDRALTPVPPRARVPNPQSVELGLNSLRLRKADSTPEAAIAPIQPSHFEIVTTGRRPGVLFFQYDGLSFADGNQSFDAWQSRFGRPADRGPVVFRQARAPRSTMYQPMDDLSRRRQTFIGSDYIDEARHLLPFALAKGSMTALRTLGSNGPAATVDTILLRLARTDASTFSISGGWNGVLKLTATLYAVDNNAAVAQLATVGLTKPEARFVLAIDGKSFAFAVTTVGAASLNPYFKPQTNPAKSAYDVSITLSLSPSNTTLAQGALQSADAESSASLIISLPVISLPVPAPAAPGAPISDLECGPPRLLSLPVPIAAYKQPSLRVDTATLAFGDPAYDREISSKTASASQQVEGEPYLLALDRLEYDMSASIYFAAGHVVTTSLKDQVGKDAAWDPADEQMVLQLGVLRKATPAAVHPSPLVVAARNTLDGKVPPQHRFAAGKAYTIALADLREVIPNKKDDWGAGYTVQAPSPAFVAGDRLVVTVTLSKGGTLEVAVTIVADPVLSPPAAVYGLATLDQEASGSKRLTSSLFATAPLPQIVEFQDLAGDLAKGLVRRRALFVWPFCPRTTPDAGKPYGALVKIDRAGGGQLPQNEADFRPLLS